MKKILGLDLGSASIGWAMVNEAEKENEKSSIIKIGARVIHLDNFVNSATGKESKDPLKDFTLGRGISTSAGRTQKRGARRNLQRYKLRREHLLELLKEKHIIDEKTVLSEQGKNSTHSLWKLRAEAVEKELSLENFARVLLSLNKKRGYKSNRKAIVESDGQAIDGMKVALELQAKQLTPGQYVLSLLEEGKKQLPDFYRSDLQSEFDKVWKEQCQYYPEILTDDFYEALKGHGQKGTRDRFLAIKSIYTAENKGNKDKVKLQAYQWRVEALSKQLLMEQVAYVLVEINNQINQSSGYLGKISDRSKELHFNEQTVGQYLYNQLKENPHTRLKNQIFYREDYKNEFDKIWETQSQYHEVLTDDLKSELKDIIIFYQRKLKTQKGLVSICELEGKEVELIIDGKPKKKIIGPKVIPRSSPLFQEFKIWQMLNNMKFENKENHIVKTISELDNKDCEIRKLLFEEVNTKGKMTSKEVLKFILKPLKSILKHPEKWEIKNFKDLEGNHTNWMLNKAYQTILPLSGHEFDFTKMNASKIKETIRKIFNSLAINTAILDFNAELEGEALEKQASYQLWHLLYSYEGDDSPSGNEILCKALTNKFDFSKEFASELAKITFQSDYGSLSARAIRKLLPFMKEGHQYSKAAKKVYEVKKEENEKPPLDDYLDLLPKNSLRNPMVEKILNQMVNVVNAIIDQYGKPDEIRIELARELKESAKKRAKAASDIEAATKRNEEIKKKLKTEFPPFNGEVKTRVTKNDIIRYKLWSETGEISIYSGQPIKGSDLFANNYDIEHIIPKATLFDDSFSNKTLCERDWNREKGNTTAYDYLKGKLSPVGFEQYIQRVEHLHRDGKISDAKYENLLRSGSAIPDGFLNRDLSITQYITKKARQMLLKVVRNVTPTTGKITDKLREDWGLINVLKELNLSKYANLNLVEYEKNKNGEKIPQIKEWTKRNDHRHHAIDALTVAFTKHNHIHYYNYLNARHDEKNEEHQNIIKIEQKETYQNGNKRLIKPPMSLAILRKEAKNHLENTLISFQSNNKVVTSNKNKTKKKKGVNEQESVTPRGQLHEETIYGKSEYYEKKLQKVTPKFDEETIMKVAKKRLREALLSRLKEFDNNPKKAFGGKNALSKKPVWLDENHTVALPEEVELVEIKHRFTIRKDIDPDFRKDKRPDLKVKKVIDKGIRTILENRLMEFGGDAKKAFSHLDEKPIWLIEPKLKSAWRDKNKPEPHELGIKIKRVTISGVSNAEPLHYKKDHHGREIQGEDGKPVSVDYVSSGNNHHIAIYEDTKENFHEQVVSFHTAVARVKANSPAIWNKHPEHPEWTFKFTIKRNEYFVFPNEQEGFNPRKIDMLDRSNYRLISPNLFRVQKITSKYYVFRHHLESQLIDKKETLGITWERIQSCNGLKRLVKVQINHLGNIVKVGE